jgi:hypothetical protein
MQRIKLSRRARTTHPMPRKGPTSNVTGRPFSGHWGILVQSIFIHSQIHVQVDYDCQSVLMGLIFHQWSTGSYVTISRLLAYHSIHSWHLWASVRYLVALCSWCTVSSSCPCLPDLRDISFHNLPTELPRENGISGNHPSQGQGGLGLESSTYTNSTPDAGAALRPRLDATQTSTLSENYFLPLCILLPFPLLFIPSYCPGLMVDKTYQGNLHYKYIAH